MKNILTICTLFVSLSFNNLLGQEVTITIGYPDNENHFLYSIPTPNENAQFGGEYYFKVKNTGNVDLTNWQINTKWKALNSTWGIVEKTVVNPNTGEINLTGPSWDLDLNVGESFVLNGEWVASASIEDWVEFLPQDINMSFSSGSVNVIYDNTGTASATSYTVEKVLPYSADRKTFEDLKIVAYFPIFDSENAWCSLQRYGQNIDQLRVQLYSITPNGELRAGQDLPNGLDPIADLDYWYDYIDSMGVVQYCIDNNIELIPVVYNYNGDIQDFDQIAVNTMMTNPSIRAAHLTELNQLLNNHSSFAGIDIDYESLMASDRDNYSLFMEDLATLVHAQNKILTTAVHTKVGPGTWYGPLAQDYQRLGNAVDEILLMTYDLHWATSPTFNNPPPTAGCQATPDWMNDVASFAVTEIDDPSKVQLGIPFYGYRWKFMFENHTLNDPGVGLTYNEGMDLINSNNLNLSSINRDPNGNELNFVIDINGVDWICYFQDSAAIDFKLQSLNERDLRDYIGGIGIWRLGQESDGMWNATTYALHGTNAIINQTNCNNNGNSGSGNTNSIEENKALNISIYPNPANDVITVNNNELSNYSLQIVDVFGKTIINQEINSGVHQINISNLSNGYYFVTITNKNKIRNTIKLVVIN